MAHFRGVIHGQRGEASRLGSKQSGLYARVQSWSFDVVVEVRHNKQDNEDWAQFELVPHNGGQTVPILDVNLTTGKAFARRDTIPA